MRQAIDKTLNKLLSRKLMVWLTATSLYVFGRRTARIVRLGSDFISLYWFRRA